MSLIIRFVCSVVLVLVSIGSVCCQDSDPIEMARMYPPNMSLPDEAVASIDWQISQLQQLMATYAESRNSIESKIDVLDESIKSSREKIKTELQNLDAEGQSKLVARAMEKLLDAKLELATLESSLEILVQQMENKDGGKLQKLKEQEAQIEIETAKSRYELAATEYQKMKKLHESGSLNQQQLSRALTTSEIASLELKAAQTRASIERERAKAQTAQKISDYRFQIKPIQARIATLTEFLDSVSKSNKHISEIASLRRAQKLWMRDMELVASELFELSRKKIELETLRKLIQSKEGK